MNIDLWNEQQSPGFRIELRLLMTLFGHQFQISLTHFILYYIAIIGMQTVIVYLGEHIRV